MSILKAQAVIGNHNGVILPFGHEKNKEKKKPLKKLVANVVKI